MERNLSLATIIILFACALIFLNEVSEKENEIKELVVQVDSLKKIAIENEVWITKYLDAITRVDTTWASSDTSVYIRYKVIF